MSERCACAVLRQHRSTQLRQLMARRDLEEGVEDLGEEEGHQAVPGADFLIATAARLNLRTSAPSLGLPFPGPILGL